MEINGLDTDKLQGPQEGWPGLGIIESVNDVALFGALQKAGEPVKLIKEPPTMFTPEELGMVSPEGEAERLRRLVLLLKLSPQYQLLYAVEKNIFSRNSRALIDDVLHRAELTEAESMMYDTAYRNPNPQWPLLFPPLSVSKELRAKLKSRINTLRFNTDPSKAIKDALSYAAGSVTGVPIKKDKLNIASHIRPLIRKAVGVFDSLAPEDREELMGEAYNDLTKQIGRLESLEIDGPSWVDDETRYNFVYPNYDDPRLLMMEELQHRGYNISLFKAGILEGNPIKEVLVVVSDKKDASLVQACLHPDLRELYFQDNQRLKWVGKSEEERKQLLAWSLMIGIENLEERISFEKKTDLSKLDKLVREDNEKKLNGMKAELRQLREAGVVPPGQDYFRKRASEEVDEIIRIQEELRLKKEGDISKKST